MAMRAVFYCVREVSHCVAAHDAPRPRNRENLTTTQFAVKLYDELLALRGEEPINFASFLRVCCLRYLSTSATRRRKGVSAEGGGGGLSDGGTSEGGKAVFADAARIRLCGAANAPSRSLFALRHSA